MDCIDGFDASYYVENGRVVGLDVSKSNLEFLPSSIGELTALRKLNLAGNNLTVVPGSVGQLTSLKDLVSESTCSARSPNPSATSKTH